MLAWQDCLQKRKEKEEKTAKGQTVYKLQSRCVIRSAWITANIKQEEQEVRCVVCIGVFLLVSLLISPQTVSPEDETEKRLSHDVAAIFLFYFFWVSVSALTSDRFLVLSDLLLVFNRRVEQPDRATESNSGSKLQDFYQHYLFVFFIQNHFKQCPAMNRQLVHGVTLPSS